MEFKNILIIGLLVLCGYFFYATKSIDEQPLEVRTKYEPDTSNTDASANNIDQYETRGTDPQIRITNVESATIALFEESAPSVVFINTSKVKRDYWSRNVMEIPAGSGSGFIWDKNGHIVTNYHVIKGASKITVTLSDQTTADATLVGTEPDKDLAVIRVDLAASQLKPIKVGSSHDLKVGQAVYAIGNPFGLDQSLTTGIISALGREINSITGRPIKEVIQTDAAINPGNSGGPLLDSSGRLIGVNTMIYSPSGASAGIGFSIPVDEVNWTITDLLNKKKRPVIGVTLVPAQYIKDLDVQGAMILEVSPGSPAEKAQLNPTERNRRGEIIWGDIIIDIDGKNISSNKDLIETLKDYQPGDEVEAVFLRNGERYKTNITLGSAV